MALRPRIYYNAEQREEIWNRWQDKTHFIRQFRKSHGVTLAAWRRHHRAKHVGDIDE